MHCYVGEDHQQKENNPTVLENNQADGPSRAVCLKSLPVDVLEARKQSIRTTGFCKVTIL
ncbi:hypothetical protein T06_1116 [Trichinella sp. T6]|nr:hypothetical protein T06_1116 [Trichinella sp. T6]